MANNMYKRLSFTNMKTNQFNLFILITCLLLCPIALCAQVDNRPTSYVGIQLGGGFSNLFVTNPMQTPDLSVQPLLGGGGMAGLFYNLQYKHLLFHTGFGVNYTFNRNDFAIQDVSAGIVEYPTMKYQYTFDNHIANTTYGVGYVPVMLGLNYEKWYFLAGAKLGVLSFANSVSSHSDMTIWAMDEDIIDPLEGLFTHEMKTFNIEGMRKSLDIASFNAMLSAEVGITLNKRAWLNEKERRKYDRAQRYRNSRQKKSFKQLTTYRLSLFADYGLSNIRPTYEANMAPYQGQDQGGMLTLNSVSDMNVHSIYGYEPYKESKLNNLFVGLKLTMQVELPKKAPKKGALALPYMYVYVKDDVSNKPVNAAHVKIQSETSKSKLDKYTDQKRGRVSKGFLPGPYWIHVSHNKYLPHDTIHFEHRDDYDTVYVALHPKHNFKWPVVDASNDRPIHANFELLSSDGTSLLASKTDSTCSITGALDDRLSYKLKVSAENYEPLTIDMDQVFDNNYTARLMPINVKTFVLRNMYFATAQTTILPSSKPALDMLYELLSENPELVIRIVGHTDDVGTEKDNQVLSEGRSKSICKEMINRGIDAKRISTTGKGELEPLLPNTSADNRQKNRRVEIEIISGAENVNIDIERLTK